MSDAIEALTKAATLLKEEGWCREWGYPGGPRCVLHALYDAAPHDNDRAYLDARAALVTVVSEDPDAVLIWDLGGWNDSVAESQDDVTDAIDRAIQVLQEGWVPAW